MNWMDEIGGLLNKYAQGAAPQDQAADDFDQIAQRAPREVVAQGVGEAFRSQQTPPFPNMLGQMFGQSDPQQRAGILNTLLATVGPALLSGMLSRGGMGGGLGSLAGMLGGGMTTSVTPEQASQIQPEAVESLAREAEQQDPDIVNRVSDFYAEHPTLVKGLGAVAIGIALNHLSKQKRGGLF